MSRQDHIREFAAKALADGRVDYFIGWKQGYNSSEVIPAFVKDPAAVDQLIWTPLCHHNLVTFLKRNMPDPTGAKIGVCVKGCDSRTLGALLQEELVDKDKLYVVGVPCDGIVDRRKLEKEFADEIVDIAFPEKGKVAVTTRKGDRKEFAQNDFLLENCTRCRYPNPVYSDDTAGPLEAEPERGLTRAGLERHRRLREPLRRRQAGPAREDLLHLRPLLRLHQRLSRVLLLGQVRQSLPAARAGQPEGRDQGEPALPDGPHVPRGRPLPVVRRL